MDLDSQREFVWDGIQKNNLIESVQMRIPLPVFYLSEDNEGRMVVVDGLQRLSTLRNFVDGGLELQLMNQAELQAKTSDDLSPRLQNGIEDCNLTLYIMDSRVPERALLDTFERVNSGLPLTKQQVRNSLYMGPAARFLKSEAETDNFIRATGGSLLRTTMRDLEFVNRFCGFQILRIEGCREEMDEFLRQALQSMNKMSQIELAVLSAEFRNGLENNWRVFGEHGFRKQTEFQVRRFVIDASLWDVMVTELSCYQSSKVEDRSQYIRTAFFDLMKNEKFNSAVTYGTNDCKRVLRRVELARTMWREAFNALPT